MAHRFFVTSSFAFALSIVAALADPVAAQTPRSVSTDAARLQPFGTVHDVPPPPKSSLAEMPVSLQTVFERAVARDDGRFAIAPKGAGTFGASANGLQYTLSSSGSTMATPDGGRWSFSLAAATRGEASLPLGLTRVLRPQPNELRIVRGTLTEWYLNGPPGLEQGWTIDERLQGSGPINLTFAESGSLHATVKDDGRTLKLCDRLSFVGLQAMDARRRSLPVRFAPQRGRRVRIEVDDRDAAYPITIDPYVQQAELFATAGQAGDKFGFPVALSSDGGTALVGAYLATVPGLSHQGAAYVFTRSGDTWTQQQRFVAGDAASNDTFGWSVALSGDGNSALVGAFAAGSSKGKVYLYTRSGGSWTQTQEIVGGITNGQYGVAVALSSDGSTAVIGAIAFSNVGQIQILTRPSSGVAFTLPGQTITNSTTDWLGYSVAASSDGSTVLAGAPHAFSSRGGAYVYTIHSGTGTWVLQRAIDMSLSSGVWSGWSVSLSANGDTALIGAPGLGSSNGTAFVFVRSAGTWAQQQQFYGEAFAERSGFGVALSGSGDIAVIGGYGGMVFGKQVGTANLYTRSSGTWSLPHLMIASNGEGGDQFGSAVAVAADGNTVLIGAPSVSASIGAVYVFTNPVVPPANTSVPTIAGTPRDGQTLTATTGTWTGTDPITYSYQWERCHPSCGDLARPDATTPSLLLTSNDAGATMRVRVTATNAVGSASAESVGSAVVNARSPVNTALPVITGTAQDGHSLTASLGTWTGSSPLSYFYQWERCSPGCADKAGETSATLLLGPSDVGATIRVRVMADNSSLVGGSHVAVESATTAVVTGTVATPPVNTARPTIAGTPQVGQTLTVLSNGIWTGTAPITFSYQWRGCYNTKESPSGSQAGCVDIPGATGSSFLLNTSYFASIRVRVTADNSSMPGGGRASADSGLVGLVLTIPSR